MMLLRSLLFVPGNNLRMITKSATSRADAVILDLEDSVGLRDKPTARVLSAGSLRALKMSGATTVVRVNAISTGLIGEDLRGVCGAELDAVMLPKAESAADIVEIDTSLSTLEAEQGVRVRHTALVPLIETAKGVNSALEIATASTRVIALAFGVGDYCRDLGLSPADVSDEQSELLYARSRIVNCAVAAGTVAVDSVSFKALADRERFAYEAQLAVRLGFKGKLLIHPSQVASTNEVFAPSKDGLSEAEGVVAAFEEAQSRGLGATTFKGRMIDIMSYRQAEVVIGLAAAIGAREDQLRTTGPQSLSAYFR